MMVWSVTAESYFQQGSSITPQDYFASGSTLDMLVVHVKLRVTQEAFQGDQALRSRHQQRLSACIEYWEQNGNNFQSGVLTSVWQWVFGCPDTEKVFKEAKSFESLLRQREINSLAIPVLLDHCKPLARIVQEVHASVFSCCQVSSECVRCLTSAQTFFGTVPDYRKEFRSILCERAKQEYSDLYGTAWGIAHIAFSYISAQFNRKQVLDRAIEIIRTIDVVFNALRSPGEVQWETELIFRNTPYLTKAMLKSYTDINKNLRKLDLRGCFQLTEADIDELVKGRNIAVTYPNDDDFVIV